MEGRPYFVPRRRRRRKFKNPVAPNPLANIQNEMVPLETNHVGRDMYENNEMFGNSKFDSFLQSNFDKAFFEMLQVNLEMMEVANHFLADYSSVE